VVGGQIPPFEADVKSGARRRIWLPGKGLATFIEVSGLLQDYRPSGQYRTLADFPSTWIRKHIAV
jgi:hypothetical protein